MTIDPVARSVVWAVALGAAAALAVRLPLWAPVVPAVAVVLLDRRLGAWGMVALAFVVGVTVGGLRLDAVAADPLASRIGERVEGRAVITSAPRGRAPLRFAEAELLGPAGGRVLLRLAARQAPDRGAILRVEGRLTRPRPPTDDFDERAWLGRRGIHAVLRVDDWALLGRRDGPAGWLDMTRRSALGTFRAAGEDDAGRLVGGLVLGADEDLTRVTTEAFRAAGTAHLLAVSGQNVALLAAALSLVVWLAGGGRATAQVVCIAAVIAYVGVVGPSPSVVRAGVAGVLTATAWLLSRPVDRWHLFGAGAAVLLLANPWSLLDAGFQLSFTAVAAILLLVPPLERRLQGTSVPGLVRAPLAVSVACTLATAPIGYLHFDRMGIVAAVPANLAAAPAVAPTLWLGLTAAAVDPLAPRLGRGLARGARWPARYLLWVSRVGARLDAWSARRRVPMAIAVGGTAAVAVLAQGLAARRRRPGSPRLS